MIVTMQSTNLDGERQDETFKLCLIDSLNSDRVDEWTKKNEKATENVER